MLCITFFKKPIIGQACLSGSLCVNFSVALDITFLWMRAFWYSVCHNNNVPLAIPLAMIVWWLNYELCKEGWWPSNCKVYMYSTYNCASLMLYYCNRIFCIAGSSFYLNLVLLYVLLFWRLADFLTPRISSSVHAMAVITVQILVCGFHLVIHQTTKLFFRQLIHLHMTCTYVTKRHSTHACTVRIYIYIYCMGICTVACI